MNFQSIPKVQGIYKISNIESGLFYIGSSKNVYKRLREHFSRLRRNVHNNCHLQAVFNLHGNSVFNMELLEDCTGLTQDELLDKEQEYLDAITNWRLSYNQTRYTKNAGRIHPEEVERRNSKVQSSLGELNAFYGKTHSKDSLEEMAEAKRVRGSNVCQLKSGFWQVRIRLLEAKSTSSIGTFENEVVAKRVKYLAEEVYWYNNTSAEVELKELQKLARTLSDAAHEKGGGVNIDEKGLYAARISVEGKDIRLGKYKLKNDAENARNLAKKAYWQNDLKSKLELTDFIKINSFKTKQNAELPKGVLKRGEKYRASITVNKQKINLGTFSKLEDAIAARRAAEQALLS
jgi:group I intron endonuclease